MKNNTIREYVLNAINKINENKPGTISDEDTERAVEYYSNLNGSLDEVIDQIDRRFEEFTREDKENERHYDLNDFFDCRLSHHSLHLHVVPKDIKDDIRKMGSGFYDYVSDKLTDALDKLPDILEKSENSDVKTIMAVSPLLRSDRAKAIFVNHGFSVQENIPDIFVNMFKTDRIGLVTMPKDKFMETYSNDSKKM